MHYLLACFARMQARRIVRAPLAKLRKASAAAPRIRPALVIAFALLLVLAGLPNFTLALRGGITTHAFAGTEHTAGDLDVSFGQGGAVLTGFNLPSIGDSVASQSDGKLIVAGFSLQSSSGPTTIPGSEVARYNPDGSLDSTFGSNGILSLLEPPGLAIFGVAIQNDGKILLAGARMGSISLATARPEVLRLNSNGSLDTTFGAFGVVTNGSGVALSVTLQPNGQIVTAGLINFGGAQVFGVTRYNKDGSLDANFGAGGEATFPLSVAFSVAVQSDGKIVAAGAAGLSTASPITGFPNILSGGQFALVRLNPDGSLDTSFGNGGQVLTGIQQSSAVSQIVIQPNGQIVAAGTSESNAGLLDFVMARYNTNGSLDSSFGSGGIVTTNLDGNADAAFGVALQADGRIVEAGASFSASDQPGSSGLFFFPLTTISGASIAVARYSPDGALDTSFGSGGTVVTPLQQGAGAFSVVIPQDGKIAVAGTTATAPGAFEFALAQYDAGQLPGDFSLTPSQQSPATTEGSSATVTVQVQTASGSTPPSAPISLSATVITPGSGITATFSPSSVSPGQSSDLTLATSDTTVTGSYTVLIVGTTGTITHSTSLNLSVTGQDFSLGLSAPTITTATSMNVFPRVVIAHLGGFIGKVTVTAPKTNLPPGIELFGGASKTRRKNLVVKYRYKITDATMPGTYFLTFTGSDQAGRMRSVTLTLVVTGPATS